MRLFSTTGLLLTLTSLALQPAHAQQNAQGQGNYQNVFSEYDNDQNSTLSQTEFEQLYQEQVIDVFQSQGYVEQEQQGRPVPSTELIFSELDTDTNDSLSAQEWRTGSNLMSSLMQGENPETISVP